MERIIDKVIITICCLAVLFLVPQTVIFIVGLLLALAVSSLQEVPAIPGKLRTSALIAYLVAALFLPGLATFIPLIAYDCLRLKNWFLKLCWVAPLCLALRETDYLVFLFVAVVAMISFGLSLRTERIEAERHTYLQLRDELRELSLSLEQKNRDLQDKQDYEVRLATLAERGRIAREIHDNVGHLLTRSVLQIEAAQVLHADDTSLKTELEQLGATIHEAFDTVRASVHDLHDESFDLHTQLFAIAQNSPLEVSLEYQVEDIPDTIGYGFIAMVREAVANAAKHSDATRVRVSVVEYPAFWQLVVHDNGSRNPFTDAAGGHADGIGFTDVDGRDQGFGLAATEVRSQDFGLTASEERNRGAGRVTSEERRGPTGRAVVEERRGGIGLKTMEERRGGIGLKTMEERARSWGGILRIDYDKGFRVFVSIPKFQ